MSNTQPSEPTPRDENVKELDDMGPPLFRPSCTNCDYCTGLRDMGPEDVEAKNAPQEGTPMTAVGELICSLY